MIFDIWSLRQGDRFRHEAIIRSLCQTAYLGNHVALCRILGRYKMYVDTMDDGVASHLMLDGYWEMWNTEAILQMVRPGMTVLDIGAHCGYFTVLLSDLVGPSGHVLAFEPNPPMNALLRRTVAINGFADRTIVHELALGDTSGTASFVVPAGEPKNAHVVPEGHDPNAIYVPLSRADVIPGALEADFIKIDAEGAEMQIWEGLGAIIARGRPLTILLEFTPGRYPSAATFLDRILGQGFTLQVVDMTDGIVAVSRDAVLAANPSVDQMLVLTRS